MDVSRETLERLEVYHQELLKWSKKINLVSPQTLDTAWERHIVDSSQVYSLLPAGAGKWLDIGSGAGFPGLVVAILAKDAQPEVKVSLVESDQRKCAFLRHVSRETNTPVTVYSKRIEALEPKNADVLSARALAPLDKLFEFAERHLSPTGVALLHKGANWKEEVREAQESWRFALESHTSKTHPDAVLLEVREIERA